MRPDCTMPPPDIAQKFLDICDNHRGMLAVHCLAGLGRTGTLICMWIMKVSCSPSPFLLLSCSLALLLACSPATTTPASTCPYEDGTAAKGR